MQRFWRWPWRLLCLLLVLATTYCGGEATPEPVAKEPVELTLVSFELGQAWTAAEEYAITQFQVREPNITFDRQGFNRAPASYLTQTPPPDLMTSGAYAFLTQAAQQNLVLDLSEMWAETGLNEAFPAGFQALSAYEGKQYYLPIGYAWSAIYYNRAIFDQYGLQPPRTWEEFMTICDTLLANGETPIALAGQDTWLTMLWFDYLNLRMNGIAVHRALLQGQLPYTDSRVQSVIEQWSYLLRNGYIVERPETLNVMTALLALTRNTDNVGGGQKAVMMLVSPFWMNDFPATLQAELDFFPFPVIDPTVPAAEVVTTLGYMAPSGGAHRAETLAYLAYMGSQEGQTAMAQQLGEGTIWAPARSDIDAALLSATLQQGKAIVQDVPALVSPYILNLPDGMWPLFERAVGSFLREPEPIDDFVNALDAARQQAVAEGWLTPP
ncbi:MAG: extracellular solute-binding protein [Caldilineaceae bacterium]|nr:extracellular solute-binding protein [Caldilineaceae bacterium]